MNIQYKTPTCNDTAVCLCFFSPANFARPKMNFLYIESMLKVAKIPVFTVECVIGNNPPLLPNPTLQVRSNSCLFYKEQLYNLLVPKIPEQYTKLVFMDADIIFNQNNWIDEISKALETHDIVQPFQNAVWLDPTLKKFIKKNYSVVYFFKHPEKFQNPDPYLNHCGFAWALRRDFFNKIGGFFDKSLLGSGDSLLANICNKAPIDFSIVNYISSEYKVWLSKIPIPEIKFTYLPMFVFHMFHGSIKNRQYGSRYNLLPTTNDNVFDHVFYKNEYGLYEPRDRSINAKTRFYFLTRNEDSIDV